MRDDIGRKVVFVFEFLTVYAVCMATDPYLFWYDCTLVYMAY
jgi:hypothetical protein